MSADAAVQAAVEAVNQLIQAAVDAARPHIEAECRAEADRLRDALQRIVETIGEENDWVHGCAHREVLDIACAALTEGGQS